MHNGSVWAGLIALAIVAPTLASANEFALVDESGRLPFDADQDLKDSLDVDMIDVDGDGDLDLFLVEGSATASGFQNLLWVNDGYGNFVDETADRLPAIANNSTEVDFADVDGDGDLDAVVSGLGPNQLLINDGTGVFADAPLPQATPSGPPGFAVTFPPFFIEVSAEAVFADIDDDGDPDILISNENPFPFGPPGDQNRVLINDGTGAFSDETGARLPLLIDNTSGFATGDIDGDGDLDAVVAEIGQNLVLINDGTGVFSDETAARLPALDSSSRKAVLGDVDRDGDLDLLVGNSRSSQNRLYLNDGRGVFSDVTASHLPVDSATTTDVDFYDFDGDGDLDAYFTNVGDFVFGHGFLGEPNVLLYNDGSGRFSDVSVPRLPQRDGRSTNAAIGDVTGDGVADIVLANSGGVDQVGLPPPDGAERLLVGRNCVVSRDACLEIALESLSTTIDALDTRRAPEGDMTARRERRNIRRQSQLQSQVQVARRLLARGRYRAAVRALRVVLRRVDGEHQLRDWVAGPAASTLQSSAAFAIQIIRH